MHLCTYWRPRLINKDAIFEKIQRKNLVAMESLTHFWPMFHFYTPWNLRFSDVFRAYRTTLIEKGLSNEWNCLEKASNHVESSPVSIADFSKAKQQRALLLWQIKVALFYHRRLCASNIIMDNKSHAKSLLKTTPQLLQKENKDLFGKGFPEQASEK